MGYQAQKKVETILLPTARIPGALDLARRLHRSGYRVVVADCFRLHLCKFSSCVDRSYKIRAPRDLHGFKEDILRVCVEENVDLILPTCEEVMHIASFQADLPEGCLFFGDHFDKLHQLHSKWDFVELAKSYELSVPETQLIKSSQAPLERKHIENGYVVKREFSRGGTDVFIVNKASSSKVLPFKIDTQARWLLQERIEGRTLCSFALAWKGELLGSLCYNPSLQLGRIGVAFESLLHKKIEVWVKDFVTKSKYHGFVSFDFIEDASGEVFAIECNPRITSGIHLAASSWLMASVDGKKDSSKETSLHSAMVGSAILSILPSLIFKPRKWKDLFRILRHSKEVVWDAKDPFPSLLQVFCLAQYVWVSLSKKVPLAACPTYALEWDHQK